MNRSHDIHLIGNAIYRLPVTTIEFSGSRQKPHLNLDYRSANISVQAMPNWVIHVRSLPIQVRHATDFQPLFPHRTCMEGHIDTAHGEV